MGTEKNHYIPEFFLTAWSSGPQKELHVYERPGSVVVRRRRSPGGTAYHLGLYTAPLLSGNSAYWIEDDFLRKVDCDAARSHKLLITDRIEELQGPALTAWSRFIISIWNRNPEKVFWLKQEWAKRCEDVLDHMKRTEHEWKGKPGSPESIEDYIASGRKAEDDQRSFVRLQQTVMDLENVGQMLNNMRRAVITVGDSPERFLTSDRPILLQNGLAQGYVAMPISPEKLFVTFNRQGQLEELQAWGGRPLVAHINGRIVKQAKRFVFSAEDMMTGFIERRLGKFPDEVHWATFQRPQIAL